MSPFHYFTDAVLRAPTIGCMLMCLAASLVGVIVFLRRQSLIGEALSHSAFPGVIFGVIAAGYLGISDNSEVTVALFIMTGAYLSALAGLWVIDRLERVFKVSADAALCFVLSAFFGIGLTFASHVQFVYTSLYKQVQVYLYGQAATMTDVHILIYALLSMAVIAIITLFYKELQALIFDRAYTVSLGIRTRLLDMLVCQLIVLAVVIGIRSVGVVLMSAMLIAPAAAARQFTNRLSIMLLLSACFGLASGFLGNYFSVEATRYFSTAYPGSRLVLPTGPMIVLIASSICLFALLFAPERGFFWRLVRIALFRHRCLCENVLKSLWRFGPSNDIPYDQIKRYQGIGSLHLHMILIQLVHSGWVVHTPKQHYKLTSDGAAWAAKIIRLHRLWEVYLADYLGVGAERVHRSAEEMEHILTPELERELTFLLKDPKHDPHRQPIPPRDALEKET